MQEETKVPDSLDTAPEFKKLMDAINGADLSPVERIDILMALAEYIIANK